MTSIGERIGKIIEEKKISNTEFARILNISPAYVSKMVHGKGIPSERLIEDICEKFDICSEWLMAGTGQMRMEWTREEIIAGFIGKLLRDQGDTFPKRYIYSLACMDEAGWAALEACTERVKNL